MRRSTRRTVCRALPWAGLLAAALLPGVAMAEDPSVASRLEARGIQYVVDEDGDYKVTYRYSDEGRSQLAFVSGGTEQIAGFQIREVFAPAAHLERDGVDGARALALLADSSRNKFGSWEVRGEHLFFVIKLPDSADASQLESALEIVAEIADNKEIEFSGQSDTL